MNFLTFERLVVLRCVVGYLGEQALPVWWSSAFFSSSSNTFLNPVFPRTPNLARYTGVTQAASLVHDQQIGIGRVYHLFRLPEDLEQELSDAARIESLWEEMKLAVVGKDTALAYLRGIAGEGAVAEGGPVRVGDLGSLQQERAWASIASAYARAFERSLPTFPYFSEATS